MRIAAVTLVLCASCRAVLGLEPPMQQAIDATPLADTPMADSAIDAKPNLCTSDSDLVACFEFEGTVVDLAPIPNAITVSNVSYLATGVSGQALVVDTASRLRISDSGLLDVSVVTLEAWIRLKQAPTVGSRFGVFDVNGQYGMFISDTLALTCTGVVTFASGNIAIDRWTHVACAIGTTSAQAYVNGNIVGLANYSGSLSTAPTDGAEIAGNSPDGASRLIGTLDIVRVYHVVRGSTDICIDSGGAGCL